MSTTPKSRSSTSRVANVHKMTEIVSPRPERPTSSQSRKKFSKILDLDQTASSIRAYNPGHPKLHSYKELGRVDETASPARTPHTSSPYAVSPGNTSGGVPINIARPTVTPDKRLGLVSCDTSTFGSFLDRHIECLGLKPEGTTSPDSSTCRAEKSREPDYPAKPDNSDASSTILSLKQELPPLTRDLNRPTSLSSSAQWRLMPRRLFASFSDGRALKTPLASSESNARFPADQTDENIPLSYGWLPLLSESNLTIDAKDSRQSLLSGDYADIESSRTTKQNDLRRHSSPSLISMSKVEISMDAEQGAAGNTDRMPYRRSKSDVVPCKKPQMDKSLRMHLRAQHQKFEGPVSDAWVSTDNTSDHGETKLHSVGLVRAPISAKNGFAELSGESGNVSQQSSASILNVKDPIAQGAWSTTATTMPSPAKQQTAPRCRDPVNIIMRRDRNRNIGEPVNNSRASPDVSSHKIRTRSSVPRLSTPVFGPTIRVSQFDLAAGYQLKSPHHKKSSLSEAKELLQASPTQYGRHSVRERRRFGSLRRIIPNSIRSCTFSPRNGTAHDHQNVVVARACREERRSSYTEQPSFMEIVPMSDSAYRKHKLLEKVKECLPCVRRAFEPRRRTSVPSRGFLT